MILRPQKAFFRSVIIFFCCVTFILSNLSLALADKKQETPQITIDHKPIEYFVPGYRIDVSLKVTDPEGVMLVRCYFKEKGQADYVFVAMPGEEQDTYKGVLPAPANSAQAVEYLLLIVNNKKAVYKTEPFVMKQKKKKMPPWQHETSSVKLAVKTEQEEEDDKPAAVPGFSDSITVDVVESALRFGGTGTLITSSGSQVSGMNAHWLKEFGSASSKKMWYHSWWVWSAAAVVAGGTAAVIVSQQQEEDDETASVSVSW
ncbi:hypothetical protein ACFL27_19265 [candidate division CSSED10-310 bacterium]|uniref:Uncharacterized protein n=1 Tax=candidate division CSSED10-310 bacterium TaxID=2855610 RepID=A0ABV6Z224_UNCC1